MLLYISIINFRNANFIKKKKNNADLNYEGLPMNQSLFDNWTNNIHFVKNFFIER